MHLEFYLTRTACWFRVDGRGLLVRNLRHRRKLYSERNGYHRDLTIGRLYVRHLPKRGV